MEELGSKLGTGASQGMTEGDGAAVGVDIARIQTVLNPDHPDRIEACEAKASLIS